MWLECGEGPAYENVIMGYKWVSSTKQTAILSHRLYTHCDISLWVLVGAFKVRSIRQSIRLAYTMSRDASSVRTGAVSKLRSLKEGSKLPYATWKMSCKWTGAR